MKTPATKKRRINPKAAKYHLRIGHSKLHRYGVFALEEIPGGRRVIEYTGKRLTYPQAWRLDPPEDTYIATLNSRYCVDGSTGGSGAEFINHSCNPNLMPRHIRNRLFFFSRRKIRAGEELTWKYRHQVKIQRVACRCGARQCRGDLRVILS